MVLRNESNRVFRGPLAILSARGQVLQSSETPPTLFQEWERSRSESEAIQMTRTACTHFYSIKRMYQSYNSAPYAKSVHKTTDSTAVTWCGQEVKSLYQQLESDNNREMGSGLCPGFSDTLLQPAKLGTPAKSSYILRRAKFSYSSRGQHATRERANHLGEKPFRPQEFLLNSVPCSQERRSDEASNQPQKAERMGGTPTFQNGRYGDTRGATERERVDGEGEPQRCILHNTNTHRPCTNLT